MRPSASTGCYDVLTPMADGYDAVLNIPHDEIRRKKVTPDIIQTAPESQKR